MTSKSARPMRAVRSGLGTRSRPAISGAVLLVIATLISACTNEAIRPTEEAWVPLWEQRRAAIPDVDEITSGGRELCDELDTDFRVSLPELLPSPSEALDAPVQEWSSLAIRIVFECPTDPSALSDQLETLDLLAAEIDGGVDFQG